MADQAPSGSRKRSRAVSSLTEEQIQHKRNIDRRAQRAFRQRTKDCISHLEQQFKGLQETCGQHERDLHALRQQKQSLIQCLETVVDLASTTLRRINQDVSNDGETLPAGTEQVDSESAVGSESAVEAEIVDYVEHDSSSSSHVATDRAIMNASQHDSIMETDHQSPATPGSPRRQLSAHASALGGRASPETTYAQTARASIAESAHPQPELTTPSESDASSASAAASSPSPHVAGRSRVSPPASDQAVSPFLGRDPAAAYTGGGQMATQAVDGTSAVGDVDVPHIGSFVAIPTPASMITPADVHYHRPEPKAVYHVLPNHLPSTCPLDSILLDFLHARRDLIARGVPVETAVGPRKPTVKAMMDPSLVTSVAPLSSVMSGVLSTFLHVPKTEKLVFFWVMCLTMTWQISPSAENYYALPPWLRPTVMQVAVRHPCWIDNIPWPGVRDLLIEKADEYPFHIFSDYYSQNVTVNWPFDSADAISDSDGGDSVLHSIFDKHIRNLKNWTVTPEFCARFPDMEAAIHQHDF